MAGHFIRYKAEAAEQLLIEPLDAMTLIFQRRSAITHMVAEPVPEILASMGDDVVDAAMLLTRLASDFDLDDNAEALASIAARLEELADLGLVERVTGHA